MHLLPHATHGIPGGEQGNSPPSASRTWSSSLLDERKIVWLSCTLKLNILHAVSNHAALCSRCQLHHVPLAIDFLMYSASHGIQKPCRPGEGPNGATSSRQHNRTPFIVCSLRQFRTKNGKVVERQTLVIVRSPVGQGRTKRSNFFSTAQSNSLHHLQLFHRQFRTRNGGVVESQTLDISRIRQGSLCCRQNFIVIHLEPTRDRLLDELDDCIRYRSKHCAEKRHHASSCTKEREKN